MALRKKKSLLAQNISFRPLTAGFWSHQELKTDMSPSNHDVAIRRWLKRDEWRFFLSRPNVSETAREFPHPDCANLDTTISRSSRFIFKAGATFEDDSTRRFHSHSTQCATSQRRHVAPIDIVDSFGPRVLDSACIHQWSIFPRQLFFGFFLFFSMTLMWRCVSISHFSL